MSDKEREAMTTQMKIDIIIEPTRAKKVDVNIIPAEHERYIEQ